MPKRGHRQPFRVEYEFPPMERNNYQGVKGTLPCYDAAEAAFKAREQARRGASGRVVNRDTGAVLATFEPAPTEEET